MIEQFLTVGVGGEAGAMLRYQPGIWIGEKIK